MENKPERLNFTIEIKKRKRNIFKKWEERTAKTYIFENQKTFKLYQENLFLNTDILEIRYNYLDSPQGNYIFNPNISSHY